MPAVADLGWTDPSGGEEAPAPPLGRYSGTRRPFLSRLKTWIRTATGCHESASPRRKERHDAWVAQPLDIDQYAWCDRRRAWDRVTAGGVPGGGISRARAVSANGRLLASGGGLSVSASPAWGVHGAEAFGPRIPPEPSVASWVDSFRNQIYVVSQKPRNEGGQRSRRVGRRCLRASDRDQTGHCSRAMVVFARRIACRAQRRHSRTDCRARCRPGGRGYSSSDAVRVAPSAAVSERSWARKAAARSAGNSFSGCWCARCARRLMRASTSRPASVRMTSDEVL